jgi:hypothetical protein
LKARKFRGAYDSLAKLVDDLFTIGNEEPTFDLTLNSSTTITTISNSLVGIDSVIAMMPTSAAAATEAYHISSLGKKTFDITHSSGSSVRTYKYMVHG